MGCGTPLSVWLRCDYTTEPHSRRLPQLARKAPFRRLSDVASVYLAQAWLSKSFLPAPWSHSLVRIAQVGSIYPDAKTTGSGFFDVSTPTFEFLVCETLMRAKR